MIFFFKKAADLQKVTEECEIRFFVLESQV